MVDRIFDYVGKSVPRNDGWDKATGHGLFTYDVNMPKQLYAKVLRSPYANARIVSLDTSAAEALPGVKAVATPYNTTQFHNFNTAAVMVLTPLIREPILDQRIVTDTPRYIGDEVAAVAAISEKIAEQAIKLIKVEYEELPAVFDALEAAKEDSPLVHPELPQVSGHNVCGAPAIELGWGDFAKGWQEGEVFTEVEMKLPRQKQVPMEPCGAVAEYTADGRLNVVSTTQTPHLCKMMLARVFDLPEGKIYVSNPPHVGGGFGEKIGFSQKAEVIACCLSMMTHRPVKFIYDRQEDFIATDTRHEGYLYGKMAAKKDGTLLAMEVKARMNTGAYATFGAELVAILGALGAISHYRIPNVSYAGTAYYTNQCMAGAMRGYGSPQGAVIVETMVDDIAKQLNMDPVEIRKMNSTRVGDKPFLYCGSTALNECLDRVAASIGWAEKRGKPKSGVIRRGVGIGCGSHCSNAAPDFVDYDCVNMRIEGDGSLYVSIAIPEIGPGTSTALMQIAADTVGVRMEDSKLRYGDSDAPYSIGSHASRSLYSAGHVVVKAGERLKGEILDWAAEFLKADRNQLQMRKGVIEGDGKRISLKDLAYAAHRLGKRFQVTDNTIPPNSPPWHAHAAEVEVDTETGVIRPIKIAAAHDVGRAVNPTMCEGQIEGAIAQAMGYVLREELSYVDGKGFYNDGYHKYMLPTIGDMPELDVILLESNDPEGPCGVKGLGEGGTVPTAPAILSAVEDAIGIRFYEFPLTPGRVLAAINEARKNGADI
ncbi:MAG: xanthine dehydrogenase family protein molybdopterin-binding subunit [Pelotomaculum sp.]|jgi:xanthine dehydrogenase molybdenum-binding subunit